MVEVLRESQNAICSSQGRETVTIYGNFVKLVFACLLRFEKTDQDRRGKIDVHNHTICIHIRTERLGESIQLQRKIKLMRKP